MGIESDPTPQPGEGGDVVQFPGGQKEKPVEDQIREATHDRLAEGNEEVPPWVTDSKGNSPQFEHRTNAKGETQAEVDERMKADLAKDQEFVDYAKKIDRKQFEK
jgi:hypothetical protein